MNILRNIAWSYVDTDFVFNIDIDFLPSDDFSKSLDKLNPNLIQSVFDKKACLVVPSYNFDCALSKCIINRTNEIFRNQESQKATNYSRLISETDPYIIEYTFFYEPYVIISKNSPKFSEVNFNFYKDIFDRK
jgi:hypothetical protein